MDSDGTPAGLFESYEQDFRHIIQSISDKLEGSGKDQRGEQRKAALRKVELELDEADDIVSQLEVEIQGIPQSIKASYLTRLRQAKSDLTKYKKLSKDLHARVNLLGGPNAGASFRSDDPYADERTDRERLLSGTVTLSEGSQRLANTHRIALESEDMGVEILRNLRGQRETIENTRDTLQTADSNIDRADSTIRRMIRQMYKQRVMLSAIAVFFVALILTILYFKLIRRR
ncbi:vesicle transport v-snare protein vti1 [Tricholoma matsutake]|nr:vesicle transport v-snare protein vti1 [Tricholoma matsutake 945]